MPLSIMEHDRLSRMDNINMPVAQNTSTSLDSEEIVADKDEPPDQEGAQTPRQFNARASSTDPASFLRVASPPTVRKLSLLSQAIHSESDTPKESRNNSRSSDRYRSSAKSSWSHGSTASTADLSSDNSQTSAGTRDSSPSPPLPPATFSGLPPVFNKNPFGQPVSIRHDDDDHEHVGPLQKTPKPEENDNTVEVQLGRKRFISFACGRTDSFSSSPKPKEEPSTPPPQQKRPSIRFACPAKVAEKNDETPKPPRMPRRASPAPRSRETIKALKTAQRSHRGSDSTVRNASPKAQRKLSYIQRHARRLSTNSDLGRSEATRFHEFASSEEEVDEWIHESTVHRSRLTVDDTLKVEKNLRQLGQEVEDEEAIEDEEADLEDIDDDADEEDDDEEEDDDDEEAEDDDEDESEDEQNAKAVVEDGWSTDDEQGFAGSESDSDGDSDYQWWAPGKSTAATSVEHIRPHGQRAMSNHSISSTDSALAPVKLSPPRHHRRRRSKPMPIRPRASELPDSTDFVCGTLDEDRPLEDAYLSCLEQKRAAKHKATPQDIDPTFPTSDPEMEDDEEEEEENDENEPTSARMEESDHPLFFCGTPDSCGEAESRGRTKRSPIPSPKRLHSPPPRRATLRSPPPRRLRSPPPAGVLRSPPPTRQGSDAVLPKINPMSAHIAALARERHLTFSASLPREAFSSTSPDLELSEGEDENTDALPTRSAIDIKEGLERKRARRREKLYQKHCKRKECEKGKPVRPGKGCERMREIGVELAAYCRGLRPAEAMAADDKPTEARILSV